MFLRKKNFKFFLRRNIECTPSFEKIFYELFFCFFLRLFLSIIAVPSLVLVAYEPYFVCLYFLFTLLP